MTTQITPLGDKHNGNQTCLIQTKTSKYIKKPRGCKTENAFSLFVVGLSKLGFESFARGPEILTSDIDNHTEKFEENLATDIDGIDRYYRRIGILTFVCYLFGSADLHCENIIASGDMPVLLDMETLLSGKIMRSPKLYNLSKSVLCSHLLCNFMRVGQEVFDVSGFSGVIANYNNVPRTEEKRYFLCEKYEEFVCGFEYAYKFFQNNKNEISKLLHLFDKCEFRQILRPTDVYNRISKFVLSSEGSERNNTAYKTLARAYENDIDKNRLEKCKLVLDVEIDAVLKNEIPLFYCKGSEKALYSRGTTVFENFLEASPVEFAKERLLMLSEEDLIRQKQIIYLSVSASTPIQFKKNFNININSPSGGEICAKIVTDSQINDFPACFAELSFGFNDAPSFVSSGFSLYSGLSGILCMYAALYRKTGKQTYKSNLFKCYESIHKNILSGSNKITVNSKNGSLANGIGGILSCMIHISQLIDEKSLFAEAEQLAKRICIHEVDDIDYLNGLGALPKIFNKLGITFDKSAFDKSLDAVSVPATTGVAHGASGLMLTAFGVNKDFSFIEKLIKWENSNFSEIDGNWFSLSDKKQIGFKSGWCGGAPGIGMSRLYLKKQLNSESFKRICETDLQLVKNFLNNAKQSKYDSLCCGSASRIMAGSCLGIEMDNLYNSLCDSEKRENLSFVHPANTFDINLSLMQGFAGVAYALAMYRDPLSGGMLI